MFVHLKELVLAIFKELNSLFSAVSYRRIEYSCLAASKYLAQPSSGAVTEIFSFMGSLRVELTGFNGKIIGLRKQSCFRRIRQ